MNSVTVHLFCLLKCIHYLYLSVTNIAFLSTRLSMEKLSMQFCCLDGRSRDSFYVSSYRAICFFVFFILKTATAIKHSGVISNVKKKIVEKFLISFQCQEDS